MKNRVSIFDIILTVLLAAVACFGIGFSVHNGVDKGSGEVTLENYRKYLNVTCSLSSGMGGSPYSMQYDYTLRFTAESNYVLKNVTVGYTLESQYSDLNGTYSASFELIDDPVTTDGKANYEFPKDLTVIEVMNIYPDVKVEIISVTGVYEYSRGSGGAR